MGNGKMGRFLTFKMGALSSVSTKSERYCTSAARAATPLGFIFGSEGARGRACFCVSKFVEERWRQKGGEGEGGDIPRSYSQREREHQSKSVL